MRTLQDVVPSPEQLPILEDDGPGFRLIRGAAGSGKTTAALLRLRQLCGSRRNRRKRLDLVDPVRILVLTFNRTLRGYIDRLAEEQINTADDLELTVETFGNWALNLVRQQNLITGNGEGRIRALLSGIGVAAADQNYFVGEVAYVLGRFPPDQRTKYLEAVRAGRGRAPAVPRELRRRLLEEVIRPYEGWKYRGGMADWNDIALKASKVPSQRYDVVIIDESQDFSANQMRAVLKHLDRDHATTFIIDATQRIYPQGFQWREIGINMRPEMVFTLARNHRNTAEIVRLASSLVRGLPPDEDGILPDETECQESGVLPEVVVGKYSAQINYMLDHVQTRLLAGDTVAILHPKGGGWFDFTRNVLRQRGIGYCELAQEREWPTGPELLALSTIHSAKGLEFDHVLMPGLNDEVTPHGDEDGDGTLDSLRRLIAMGVGRARKTVNLGYKPEEVSTVFDHINPETYRLVEI